MSFVTGLSVSRELLKRGVEAVITEGGFGSTVLQTAEQLSKWMDLLQLHLVTRWWCHWKSVLQITQWIALVEQRFLVCFTSFAHRKLSNLNGWTFCGKLPPLTQIQPSISMLLVRFLMKLLVQPTSGVSSQEEVSLSYEEQNALRYAAGYIPQALTKKISTPSQRSAHSLSDWSDDISSDSQDWIDLIDRGVLKHVNDTTYMFFHSMELMVRRCFQVSPTTREF